METRKYPQVLLLGNGLNRAYAGAGWGDLIKEIQTNEKIDPASAEFKNAPFPLQAVLATDDTVDRSIKSNRKLFCGLEDISNLNPLLIRLLTAGFDHILTTNYSYELERAANSRIHYDGKGCEKTVRHTDIVSRAETKYLLHTYNEISFQEHTNRIWHIHGEARKPDSIILGHYYYGKQLFKIQEILNQLKNEQQDREANREPIYIQSWVDAFIMGDVYILGYGFDWSEMDLWWLLNRKKREKASHGKTFFYSMSDGDIKHDLLRSYGAEICNLDYWDKPTDYKQFYEKAIGDIENRLKKSEEQFSIMTQYILVTNLFLRETLEHIKMVLS